MAKFGDFSSEKHPDGNPVNHQQEFHLPANMGKENPAQGARTDSDNPDPWHIQPTVNKSKPTKKFHPKPQDLGKNEVTTLVASQRRGRKA